MPSMGLMWSRRDADSPLPSLSPLHPPPSTLLSKKNALEDQLRLSKEHGGADVNYPPPPLSPPPSTPLTQTQREVEILENWRRRFMNIDNRHGWSTFPVTLRPLPREKAYFY